MTYILFDFEPIVLDEAGFGKNIGLDGEIYLQEKPPKNKSLEGAREIVKKWHQKVDNIIMGRDDVQINSYEKRPFVTQSIEDLNGENLDLENWFGILDFAPGLRYLVTLGAPVNFGRGYFRGSQIITNEYID